MAKSTNLPDLAEQVAARVVVDDRAKNVALAEVPPGIELSAAEQAVLGRIMEYTRKGSMKPCDVTRQQWIEDFLTRGFTVLDQKRWGRAPGRLRITNPANGKFYEVQSMTEIRYVERRWKALYGRIEAEAEPRTAPAEARPVPVPAADAPVAPETVKEQPSPAALWDDDARQMVADSSLQVGSFADVVLTAREDRLSTAVKDLLPDGADGRGFARSFFASVDRKAIGPLLAVLQRRDVGNAAWAAFHREIGREPGVKSIEAAVEVVRAWAGEESWRGFLADRAARQDRATSVAHDRVKPPQKADEIDFSYGKDDELTPRGRKTRIAANLAAIDLLKTLENEDRPATPAEKQILARYNGWGADKEIFNSGRLTEMLEVYPEMYGGDGRDWLTYVQEQAAREERAKNGYYSYGYTSSRFSEFMSWYKEYGESAQKIKSVLSKDEWNAAAASILNAHYTDEKICHFLWDVVKQADFRGGKVLEPANGSGRILAAMPAELKAESRTEAVELDSISARISKKMFPQTKVHECGFEEAAIAPGSVDLVISNVPFSENGPGVQEGLGDVHFNLHNYFIAESMRKLKPGGLAVLITSASTMQSNDDQRRALAQMGELWGAIRLPSDAFAGNAGTDVVTDVLVLRKPDGIMQPEAETWNQVQPIILDEDGMFTTKKGEQVKTALVNEYFVRHPEMVIGKHSMNGKMYGASERGQYTVVADKKSTPIEERLAKAIESLPKGIPNSTNSGRNYGADNAMAETEKLMAFSEEKVGSMVLREGLLYQVLPTRELARPKWIEDGKPPVGIRSIEEGLVLAASYTVLRDRLQKVIATDLNKLASDEQSKANRGLLKKEYDQFVERFGTLTACTKRLRALAPQDPDMGSVLALESSQEVREGKAKRLVIKQATILSTRTLHPPRTVLKAATLDDAVMLSLNETGGVDVSLIADALGKADTDSVRQALVEAGLAFTAPESGKLVHRTEYLSGDVVTKLARARKASEADPKYLLNAKALEAVAPAKVPWEHIHVQMGATWVPPHLINRFVGKVFGLSHLKENSIFYVASACQWIWPDEPETTESMQAKWGTKRMPWTSILMASLNQQPIAIYDKMQDGSRVYNAAESASAAARAEAMAIEWKSWLNQQPDAQAELTEQYNATFNRVTAAAYTGQYLTFPDLSTGPGAMVPRGHQRRGTERFITEQSGVAAHGVGFGKTMLGILTAHESKRLGLVRKPLTVCDGANYAQFVEAHRQMYPQDRILVADDVNFSPVERENFKAQVAYGDWDCVYMSRTQFERVGISAETEARWLNDEIDDLRSTFDLMENAGQRRKARQIEKAIESKSERLAVLVEEKKARSDRGLTWEQLGVDFLVVDEAHRHKKCGFSTAHDDIKGIDATASARGRDLLIKARFIQERRDGKGVIGLTGTPCTNTMAEYWNMIRLFQPKTLEMFGVEQFDAFKSAFCVTQTAMEMNEANGRWRNLQRLSKFVNGPTFVRFLRTGMDIEMDSAKLGLKVPAHESGQIELCMVPITDTVLDKMDELAAIYETYEKHPKKKDFSWVPIVLMQMGMAASIDPRLFDPSAKDEEDSLVNELVKNVSTIYRETEKEKKAQVIFLDRYNAMDTSILNKLRKNGGDFSDVKLVVEEDKGPAESAEEEGEEIAKEEAVKVASFNLYADIKAKLIKMGVKPEEIAIIGEARNAKERREMFERINRGEIRVVEGSSDRLGIGANFQERLYAAHHFDPARNMTPDQMEQRGGRIRRQGNTNEKIREIYYGMQDTVTPAVYHRIQRKAEFIKQGLAERGVGLEFEDTGEIRLEEMKAALITDKRQLKRAEIIAALHDERMQQEVAENRIRNMASTRQSLEWQLDYIKSKELPVALRRAEFFEKHVAEPTDGGQLTIDVSRVMPASEELKAWLKENGPVFTGDVEAVTKKLNKCVDLQKDAEKDQSALAKPLGTVIINGLAMKLSKEDVTFRSSGREAEALIFRVTDPIFAKEGRDDQLVSPTHYGTADALVKAVLAVSRDVRETPKGMKLKLTHIETELGKVIDEEAKLTAYDASRISTLKADLAVLEEDMRTNPYVRGANKRPPVVAVGSTATTAIPAAKEKKRNTVELPSQKSTPMRAAVL